jgi:hypothetical protein
MAVALLALGVALAGQDAYAAVTNFLLNTTNTSTSPTVLNGSAVSGKAALQLTNTNTANGSTALGLKVGAGHAPFTVNSTTKVPKLNADLLDGIDSTGFLQADGSSYTQAVAIPRLQSADNELVLSPVSFPGFVNFVAICPALNNSVNPLVGVQNLSGTTENVFVSNNLFAKLGGEANYVQLGGTAEESWGAANQDVTTLTVQGALAGTNTQTITVATISMAVRTSDCHYQVQAFTTHP